jgi:hypothetical protein
MIPKSGDRFSEKIMLKQKAAPLENCAVRAAKRKPSRGARELQFLTTGLPA